MVRLLGGGVIPPTRCMARRDNADAPERLMRRGLEMLLKPEHRDPAIVADPVFPAAADLNPLDTLMLGIALKVHRANMQEAGAMPEYRQRPAPGPIPAWVKPRAPLKPRVPRPAPAKRKAKAKAKARTSTRKPRTKK